MWTAFPSSDYYADSATPCAHRPASGLAGPPPAARRARGASHVHHDPFDRVGSWLYPYSPFGGHSQHPAGHHARTKQPDAERAAVKQGGIVAVDDPCPPGFGSLEKSRGFYHHFAFALPFGLASTHAGVWQCRPAVALSGRLTSDARSRALAVPSFSGRLHQPGAGIPAGTDEMFDVRHLLSHGASWRRFDFLGFTHICGKQRKTGRFALKRITIKKRLRAKLRTVKAELTRRRHLPIPEQGEWLASVVRGHRNYYAVPGNIYAVEAFHQQAIEHWYRALRRRSQRTSLTWKRMGRVQARWLPPVRIMHPWPDARFDANTRGKSPVR
jgi:hypothetical protein